VKLSDKYPDAEPFQEPMRGIFVVPDHYPCSVCKCPTRFLDYMTGQQPEKGVPVCSEECAFEAIPETVRVT
jgi:hypothetical protein